MHKRIAKNDTKIILLHYTESNSFFKLVPTIKKKKKKGLKIFNVNYTHISIIEFIYEKITL